MCKHTFMVEIVELHHGKAMHTKDFKEVLIIDSRLESEKSVALPGRLKTIKENSSSAVTQMVHIVWVIWMESLDSKPDQSLLETATDAVGVIST